MRLHTLRQLLTAVILLAATASCYNYDQEEIIDGKASQFINISVSVSVSNENMTRALPAGGETGDGLEKGNARENKVNTISLFFYEDNAGINTSNENTKVSFFATYPVKPTNPVTPADNYNNSAHNHQLDDQNVGWTGDTNHQESNDNEVIYSTGDQILEENTLDVTKTYHVFVVANAPDELLANITAGETTISSVRNMVVSSVYDGSGIKTDAQNFVMSSERDATATFTNRKVDAEKNTITYYFECIHIERLAARIDFWAKTKDPVTTNYTVASYDADTYDHAGYVYAVGVKDGEDRQDHFVLTSITPFNVLKGDEYYFKRTDDANPYLAKETKDNWVLDPYTATKTTAEHPSYLVSTLTSVSTDMANAFNVVLSSCQTASTETTEDTKFTVTGSGVTADNIIIGYPMENTLKGGETPLYYYATGLAFEGYYYKKDATKNSDEKYTGGERKVFYHYLRHQGDQDIYQAHTNETLNQTDLCLNSPAMNIGIVRNNIYRVSIEGFTPDDQNELYVKLLIKVKKWDKFVHTPIYM